MTRQLRVAQSYQEQFNNLSVRQQLRPSTIEISSANVRLSSPVSMNGLQGMVMKQPVLSTRDK